MSFDNHVIAESCNISFSYDNCTASYVLSTTIQPLSRLLRPPCVADRDIIFSPGWTIVTVYCMVHQFEIWTDGKMMRINRHVLFYSCSTTTDMGDRLATTGMGRSGGRGCCASFRGAADSVTSLIARFCTFSMSSISPVLYGHQTELA